MPRAANFVKSRKSGTGRVRLGRGMAWSKADETPPAFPLPNATLVAMRCDARGRCGTRGDDGHIDLGDLLIYHLGTERTPPPPCPLFLPSFLSFLPVRVRTRTKPAVHFGALCSIDHRACIYFSSLLARRRTSCPFPARQCLRPPASGAVPRLVPPPGVDGCFWADEEPTIVCRAAEAPTRAATAR